jgi:phosphoribosyl 1,2-cyclic phosphodiesterase
MIICEYRDVIAISLQSGSSGNCIYVETDRARLLFDAGISCAQAARRLAMHGRDIRNVDALIISHDHADHVRHAGVYQRRVGMPIYITPLTLNRALTRHSLGRLNDVNYFFAGGELTFGDVTVETIPTPHDSADGAIFIVSSEGKHLGIWTDVGHLFKELFSLMPSLDAVFIESNYDPAMLENGSYPAFLKERIKGPRGHLSNAEATELLQSGGRLQWACLSHLSQNNNSPEIAFQTHREIIGNGLPLYTASRHTATGIFSIDKSG